MVNKIKRKFILINMSFFYDFLKYFDISDLSGKIAITAIVGQGIMIVGDLKLKEITDDFILFSSKKNMVKVQGNNLKIISIAKGEVVISGKINKIETGVL